MILRDKYFSMILYQLSIRGKQNKQIDIHPSDIFITYL